MLSLLPRVQWPSTCEVCGQWPSDVVCPTCRRDLGPQVPRCPRCALRMAPGLSHCGRCEGSQAPWQTVKARVDYAYPWVELIQRFKFRDQPALAGTIAELMLECDEARELLDTVDLIAPVPLAHQRLSERGYNQSWELIRALRRRVPVPNGCADLLVRSGHGAAVHTLGKTQRLRATSAVFAVNERHADVIQGARVLLVDDVMTTGATLTAAAQALITGGAGAVSAWVFARTPAPSGVE